MIDLESGTLQDILPANLVTPETKALSYAFANAQKKMLEFAKVIHIYAELSRVPERVLDLMALELGTQYYDQSFTRDIFFRRWCGICMPELRQCWMNFLEPYWMAVI